MKPKAGSLNRSRIKEDTNFNIKNERGVITTDSAGLKE